MRTLILSLLVLSSSAFGLEPGQQVRLVDACYADIEILRQMFRTGEAPVRCKPQVIIKFTNPVQVVPNAPISPDDLRSHLIGKLAHRAGEAIGESQIAAIFNFFAFTRMPDPAKRAWAIRIFYKSVYPKLSDATISSLNERLATFWAGNAGNRDKLEVLITPIILAMTSEQAAVRLLALEKVADELGAEPPLGRSDIELRGIETVANEWERIKRSHHAVQASLIHYLGRDKDLLDEPMPEDEYERQELLKRQAVRKEAVRALTNSALKLNSYYKFRRATAGLTAENVIEVKKLLDATNPYVVVAALEVIAWQYAQEWVVTERANEELELAAKLASLLKSPNPMVRRATASAYSLMHPPQSVSQIALIEALSSDDEKVRARAAEALSLGSTYQNKRIVDPAVFKVIIKLAVEGDENGRSNAAALLRQNLPVNLETVTELVESFPRFNSANQPTIRDVLMSAADRKTGLAMFNDDVALENTLRQRLSTALASGALSAEPKLKGLLTKKNIDLEQVFQLLTSENPAEVVEAAELLNKRRAAEIRPLIHRHVDAPARLNTLALRLKETASTPVGELLLEVVSADEIIPTVGRNPKLFAAVVNPSEAALGSPRARIAYQKALKGLSETSNRIHSSLRGNTEVNAALEAAIEREGQSAEDLLALVRCYEITQTDRNVAADKLLRRLFTWLEDPKTIEVRRKAIAIIRAGVPLPHASSWAGVIALVAEKDGTPGVRRMAAEIFVASYATVLPRVGEIELFSPLFTGLRQTPFSDPPELLDEAIRSLGVLLDSEAASGEVDPQGSLARCAAEINKAAAKKKK